MKWTNKELKEIENYFKTNILRKTVYLRIQKINPDRSFEGIVRMIRKWTSEGWVKNSDNAMKKLRIGYLDIESTGLKADFGFILSWCIKPRDKEKIEYSVITKKEIFDFKTDKRLIEELMKAFDNYDVLYTHWGADRRFDVPFIRTRAYAHGIEDQLPDYMEKFIMDTWPISRNKLRLHNNRLGSIAAAVGLEEEKTPLSAKIWQRASLGCPASLKYILKHNKMDVILLEGVHKKLEKIERPIYRSM